MQRQSYMNRNLFRIFLILAVSMVFFGSTDFVARAGGEQPPHNGADPNYVPTAQELQAIAAKEAAAARYMKNRSLLIVPLSLGSRVLGVGTWLEPNDAAHVNYCGPGATQVALDARLPASSVPNIDTLGTEESIDITWGVTTTSIRNVLNSRLSTTFYVASGASASTALHTRIVTDIDSNYAMVTGVKTGGMPGWGTRNVFHIVAVYGYNEVNVGLMNIYYIETASPTAGFTGTYRNTKTLSTFWTYVSQNNSQVW